MIRKFQDLLPGDVFMDPWDATLLQVVDVLERSNTWVAVDYKKFGPRGWTDSVFHRCWRANYQCDVLRAGERNADLTRLNLQTE